MACALPWVMHEGPTYSKHVPTLPGQVGGGGVTRNVAKKIAKKYNLCISGPNVLNLNFDLFFTYFLIIFMVLRGTSKMAFSLG